MKETRAHLSPTEGVAQLPAFPEEQYAILFRHGTLTVGLYAPRGTDAQTPHTRDEVYVVVAGHGTYVHGDTRRPFKAGDLMFVPARRPTSFRRFYGRFCGVGPFLRPRRRRTGVIAALARITDIVRMVTFGRRMRRPPRPESRALYGRRYGGRRMASP